MTINGTDNALSVINGSIVFKAVVLRHGTHFIGAFIVCGRGNARGFTNAFFPASGEQQSRNNDDSDNSEASFHIPKFNVQIARQKYMNFLNVRTLNFKSFYSVFPSFSFFMISL